MFNPIGATIFLEPFGIDAVMPGAAILAIGAAIARLGFWSMSKTEIYA